LSQSAKRLLLVFFLIATVLVIDQTSKQYVVDNIAYADSVEPIPALADVFQLTHSHNTGAAFGIFENAGDFFLVLSIVVVIGMLFYYPRIPANAPITRLAIGLVCGGALGNAADRIFRDHVIDFIHYQIPGVISNVSNLADHAIVFGVLLMLVDSWRLELAEKRAQEAESTEPPTSAPDAAEDLSPE
jgi:signal peptidase II